MAKTFVHRFTVRGVNIFPTDMLRYDRCYPASGSDTSNIDWSFNPQDRVDYRKKGEQFEVTLIHQGENLLWSPTAGRWSSFGWTVTGNERLTD